MENPGIAHGWAPSMTSKKIDNGRAFKKEGLSLVVAMRLVV